jgi:hypothetical protein
MENNKEIKRRFIEEMKFAGEQLEAVKDIESFELRDEILTQCKSILSQRLETGAESYQQEVPISLLECRLAHRDNLAEANEEVIDALVYTIAETILQTQMKCDKSFSYLKKAKAYLYYALYFLMVASKHDKKGKENE